MLQSVRTNYEHTIYAAYLGYISQAIVNNLAPLLFLTFVRDYGLTLDRITLMTTANFLVQLFVDLLCAKAIDRIGYRRGIVIAHLFVASGLFGMAFLADITSGIIGSPYAGLMLSVVLYAVGGGMIEVLISPIVESCPTKKKEAAMSLLHSFYCWGQVFVVLASTVFFRVFGVGCWKALACIWAIVPMCNMIYFSFVPLYAAAGEKEKLSVRGLFGQKVFWLFLVIMVCAGASEHAMNQWASTFAESGLKVSKTVGDLAGPCAFALFMGISRVIYAKYTDRLPLKKYMAVSAALCVCSYVLAGLSEQAVFGLIGFALCGFSVGIFWPGTFSIAAGRLSSGCTAMYAFMALAGDLGCSAGPTVVGLIANVFGGDLKAGLTAAMIFPIIIFIGVGLLRETGTR